MRNTLPPVTERLTALLTMMADSVRLRLLFALAGGERKVGDLTRQVGLSQPTVSHHLALLLRLKLVSNRRAGRLVYYRLGLSVSAPSPGILTVAMPQWSLSVEWQARQSPQSDP